MGGGGVGYAVAQAQGGSVVVGSGEVFVTHVVP